MPVSMTANAITCRAPASVGTSKTAFGGGRRDPQRHRAVVGELDRVGEQVAQDLLQPLRVGDDRRRQVRRRPRPGSPGPSPRPAARTPARRSRGCSAKRTSVGSTSIRPASILDRSRMSSISASRSEPALWMVRANSICFAVRLLLRVVGQQPGQQQQRVQRRTQLVAHVGQELRLVRDARRQLLRLLLQAEPGQLDLPVLRLDVALLLGQQRAPSPPARRWCAAARPTAPAARGPAAATGPAAPPYAGWPGWC